MDVVSSDTSGPLSPEQIADAAAALAAGKDLADKAASLLEIIRGWAAPALVACLRRDPAAEHGWRNVATLSSAPLPSGFEASFARQLGDASTEAWEGPRLIQPPPSIAGVKLRSRDSWLLPWSADPDTTGILILRGIPRPYPSNLAEAVARLCLPVWPLLARGTSEPPEQPRADTGGSGEPGRTLEAAAEALSSLAQRLRELAHGASDVERLERQRHQAQAEVARLKHKAAILLEERDAAAGAGDAAARELAELRQQVDESEGLAQRHEEIETDLRQRLEQERADAASLREKVDSLVQERVAAQNELESVKQSLEQAGAERQDTDEIDKLAQQRLQELEEARADLGRLQEKADSLVQERDAAQGELESLKQSLEQAGAEHQGTEIDKLAQQRLQELEEARAEAERLQPKLDSLTRAVTAAQEANQAAETEAQQLRSQVERTENELQQLREAVGQREHELTGMRGQLATLQESNEGLKRSRKEEASQLEEARAALKRVELALAYKEAEHEEAARHLNALKSQTESGVSERKDLAADLAQATSERNELRSRLAEAEKTAASERQRLQDRETEIETLRQRAETAEGRAAAAEQERNQASASSDAEIKPPAQDWEAVSETVRSALTAARRTPFVPPSLRIAFSAVEEVFGSEQPERAAGEPRARVVLLDRNIMSLDTVANELEAAGVEVLLAHYQEELGFFLKTPEGPQTTAVVCDVMAFRPEQDLLDLFAAWRRDVPKLTVVLTHHADSPIEQERVSRVPPRTAGRLTAPLSADGVQGAIRQAQADRLLGTGR